MLIEAAAGASIRIQGVLLGDEYGLGSAFCMLREPFHVQKAVLAASHTPAILPVYFRRSREPCLWRARGFQGCTGRAKAGGDGSIAEAEGAPLVPGARARLDSRGAREGPWSPTKPPLPTFAGQARLSALLWLRFCHFFLPVPCGRPRHVLHHRAKLENLASWRNAALCLGALRQEQGYDHTPVLSRTWFHAKVKDGRACQQGVRQSSVLRTAPGDKGSLAVAIVLLLPRFPGSTADSPARFRTLPPKQEDMHPRLLVAKPCLATRMWPSSGRGGHRRGDRVAERLPGRLAQHRAAQAGGGGAAEVGQVQGAPG